MGWEERRLEPRIARIARIAAIDLPGFGHDESRVMHRQQFAALVVNHRLPFALHLAHLLLRRRRVELLLDHIAQEDRFAAIRTEHLPLAAGSQRLGDLRLVGKL